MWRKVYTLALREIANVGVDVELMMQELSKVYNSSECYNHAQIWDRRLARVIAFLNPIFHSNQAARITSSLATTFILAYKGQCCVDLASLLALQIFKQTKVVQERKCKISYLTTYLYDLYEFKDSLTLEEAVM